MIASKPGRVQDIGAVRPFFFGSSDKPLFGVYQDASTRVNRGAVLMCNPFGREYLRAHRALRALSDALSQQGLASLRFDYYGCGDSAGDADQAHVEQWIEDVAAAMEELSENAPGARLSAVGLRFGAALCLLASARGPRLSKLVLWEPTVVGQRYLDELDAQKLAWLEAHPALAAGGEDDGILGFPWPRGFREAVGAVDLTRFDGAPAKDVLIVTSRVGDADIEKLAEALRRNDVAVSCREVPSASFWLRQEGIDQAVVPTETVGGIASWLAQTAR